MRLDKFLKVSRLIKRRTMAKEVSDQGRVEVNGQTAKAGTNVKVGDEIGIKLGQKKIVVRVERIEEMMRKDEANSLYSLLKEERLDD
ncbi:RNA-binding S4 domain-containing protein [Evansella sp. AB-P1]|uniref:RNA-binding S4 domain-containing protein n=1 Tax=Evansella sp. AB-P1 TaxID=3037653 RepID=UPI00241DFEBB|nr:RNA-binding S4 domain-containing protein [Evansella sp. AB-P1]MDG5789989.1 RNA-binding S4 domain-containing protein [Evansella sp. AB-P1]